MNLVDLAQIYWRALRTRAGIAALLLAGVGLIRVERMVVLTLGELPTWASALLGSWISYPMVFVAGCILTRAAMDLQKEQAFPQHVPIITLRTECKRGGWTWDEPEDFWMLTKLLRQSGADGSLRFFGRQPKSEFKVAPLVEIPQQHWHHSGIPDTTLHDAPNHMIKTEADDPYWHGQEPYEDIHLDRPQIRWWLAHVGNRKTANVTVNPY